MALTTQFDRDLRKLFYRRTAWLRAAIGKKSPGPVPAFAKNKVSPVLERLISIARKIQLKQRGRKEFQAAVFAKRQWQVKNKGWGKPAKKKSFGRWYEKNIHVRNCVYVFWSGRSVNTWAKQSAAKAGPAAIFISTGSAELLESTFTRYRVRR